MVASWLITVCSRLSLCVRMPNGSTPMMATSATPMIARQIAISIMVNADSPRGTSFRFFTCTGTLNLVGRGSPLPAANVVGRATGRASPDGAHGPRHPMSGGVTRPTLWVGLSHVRLPLLPLPANGSWKASFRSFACIGTMNRADGTERGSVSRSTSPCKPSCCGSQTRAPRSGSWRERPRLHARAACRSGRANRKS